MKSSRQRKKSKEFQKSKEGQGSSSLSSWHPSLHAKLQLEASTSRWAERRPVSVQAWVHESKHRNTAIASEVRCAPNVAAPNVAGAVTLEFRIWSPKSEKKTEKPERRSWTPENRKRRKERKKRKSRNSGFGPLKTGKSGKNGKSGCAQNPREREENELRNEGRNFWLQPKRTPEQGTAWHEGPETNENGTRNLKKGLCSRDTFGVATFGGGGSESFPWNANEIARNFCTALIPHNQEPTEKAHNPERPFARVSRSSGPEIPPKFQNGRTGGLQKCPPKKDGVRIRHINF